MGIKIVVVVVFLLIFVCVFYKSVRMFYHMHSGHCFYL